MLCCLTMLTKLHREWKQTEFRKSAKTNFEEQYSKKSTVLVKELPVEKYKQQLKNTNLLSLNEFVIPTFNSKLKLKLCNQKQQNGKN